MGVHSRVACSGAQRYLDRESAALGGWPKDRCGPGQSWKQVRAGTKRKEERLLGNQLPHDATDSTPSGDPSGLG